MRWSFYPAETPVQGSACCRCDPHITWALFSEAALKKFVVALAALALAGCTDKVDQEAKKNIFSAENPPTVIAARAEKLPPSELAQNAQLTRRVLTMGEAEVTERI